MAELMGYMYSFFHSGGERVLLPLPAALENMPPRSLTLL